MSPMSMARGKVTLGAIVPFGALATSSCLLVLDPDGYRDDAAAGGATGSTGALSTSASAGSTTGSGGDAQSSSSGQGGSGASGDGGASTSTGDGGAGGEGTAGGGGAPTCDADLLRDTANCGACDWSCGPGAELCVDGICGTVRVDVAATVLSLAVIADTVVAQMQDGGGIAGSLHLRPVEFLEEPATVIDLGSVETGIGLIGRTPVLPEDTFAYAPEAPFSGPPTITFCGMDGSACVERTLSGLPDGASISGLALDEGKLFLLAASVETRELGSIDAEVCVAGNTCFSTLTSEAGPMEPAAVAPAGTAVPFSLDLQILGAERALWWNTLASANTVCLHTWDVDTPPSGPIPCAIERIGIHRTIAAGENVFFTTGVSGADAIHRVGVPATGDLTSMPIADGDLRWPADADEQLLYAYDDVEHALVAVRPQTTIDRASDLSVVTEVGRVPLVDEEDRVGSVDASHPDYLIFSTSRPGGPDRLYRWRKPAPR